MVCRLPEATMSGHLLISSWKIRWENICRVMETFVNDNSEMIYLKSSGKVGKI